MLFSPISNMFCTFQFKTFLVFHKLVLCSLDSSFTTIFFDIIDFLSLSSHIHSLLNMGYRNGNLDVVMNVNDDATKKCDDTSIDDHVPLLQ